MAPTHNESPQATPKWHRRFCSEPWVRGACVPRSLRKALVSLCASLALTWCAMNAFSNSYDMPLTNKVLSLPVVAEVRIIRIQVRPDLPNKWSDLLCECEVLQAFRLPVTTNRLTLRINFALPVSKLEGKRAIVFAFQSLYGHFSPYRAEEGFIVEGGTYDDRYSHRKIEYAELLKAVKDIIEANQRTQRIPR